MNDKNTYPCGHSKLRPWLSMLMDAPPLPKECGICEFKEKYVDRCLVKPLEREPLPNSEAWITTLYDWTRVPAKVKRQVAKIKLKRGELFFEDNNLKSQIEVLLEPYLKDPSAAHYACEDQTND